MYIEMRQKTVLILAGSIFGIFFLLGWIFVGTPDNADDKAAQKWAIPSAKTPPIDETLKIFIGKNILGKKEAAVMKQAQSVEKPKNLWRLLGFVSKDDAFAAVVFDVDQNKAVEFKKGDKLPDGQQVFDVQKDVLVYGHDAKDLHQKAFYAFKEGEKVPEEDMSDIQSQEDRHEEVQQAIKPPPMPQVDASKAMRGGRPHLAPPPNVPLDDDFDDDEDDDIE